MMYLIVRWIKEERRYTILHYSHDLDDALIQFIRLFNLYHDARLLVDERVLEIHEKRMEYNKLKEEIKKIRDKQKEEAKKIEEDKSVKEVTPEEEEAIQKGIR